MLQTSHSQHAKAITRYLQKEALGFPFEILAHQVPIQDQARFQLLTELKSIRRFEREALGEKTAPPGMPYGHALLLHGSAIYAQLFALGESLGITARFEGRMNPRFVSDYDLSARHFRVPAFTPRLYALVEQPYRPAHLKRLEAWFPYGFSSFHDLAHAVFYSFIPYDPAHHEADDYLNLIEACVGSLEAAITLELGGWITAPLKRIGTLYRQPENLAEPPLKWDWNFRAYAGNLLTHLAALHLQRSRNLKRTLPRWAEREQPYPVGYHPKFVGEVAPRWLRKHRTQALRLRRQRPIPPRNFIRLGSVAYRDWVSNPLAARKIFALVKRLELL